MSIGVVELFIIACILGIIMLGAILLVVAFPYVARALLVGASAESRVEQRERVPAAGLTTIDLTNPVGDVEIIAGDSGDIQIRALKIARGRSTEEARRRAEAMALRIEPLAQRLALVAPAAQNVAGRWLERVDWQIGLPAELDVEVEVRAGSILLRGLRGRADASSEVGDVRARDCLFVSPATLRTSTGSIEWEGALGSRDGNYRLSSSTGRLTIRLPAGSAFTLDAQTSVGELRCDFPVQGTGMRQVVGASLAGPVNGGGPALIARTTTGTLEILASGRVA